MTFLSTLANIASAAYDTETEQNPDFGLDNLAPINGTDYTPIYFEAEKGMGEHALVFDTGRCPRKVGGMA